MELKEFIENALIQLLEGISSAQEKAKEIGGEVNPYLNDESQSKHGFLNSSGDSAAVVNFDVALTATEGTGTKAGISVLGGAINLGAGGQSSNESSVVSRIKFSVPVVLPKSK